MESSSRNGAGGISLDDNGGTVARKKRKDAELDVGDERNDQNAGSAPEKKITIRTRHCALFPCRVTC